ncbi:MAG TPA: sugar ABC transporter permease [Chloroflexota bacterium]|nr:sugar ABC transporter permease [Chloroflexota bacterium]
MATLPGSAAPPAALAATAPTRIRSSLLEREAVLGWVLVAPAVITLVVMLGYPFVYGIWLSFLDKQPGLEAKFVGLDNYVYNWTKDQNFPRVIRNTLVYATIACVFKAVLGLSLALVMNNRFRLRNASRAAFLLPWIVPTSLSTIAFLWIFDGTYSVINWSLLNLGVIERGPTYLGDPFWAMVAVIIANVWRGTPFFGITLLAGLQTISTELYEAASIDGCGPWERFVHVTLALVKPVLVLVTMFSIIATLADFALVYVLTRGGPAFATHIFGTYAYIIGTEGQRLGQGASISLSMFPFLLAFSAVVMIWLRRQEV